MPNNNDPMMRRPNNIPDVQGGLFGPAPIERADDTIGNKNCGEECILPTVACTYCGRKVFWAKVKNPDTGQIEHLPLDPSPPIYIVACRRDEEPEKGNALRAGRFFNAQGQSRKYGAFILHHATCREYQQQQKEAAEAAKKEQP